MGKTRYKLIVDMMNKMPEGVVHLDTLKTYIRMHVASKETALIEILHLMTCMGMIEEVKPFKYKLHIPKDGNL